VDQRMYTFNQASELTGLALDTLRSWRRQGKLICIRVGGSPRALRIPQCEVIRLLSQVEVGHESNGAENQRTKRQNDAEPS
jgi:predicted site-specific integrase-resolvase